MAVNGAAVTPTTTYPTTDPATLAAGVVIEFPPACQVLEIFGRCTAGSGSAWLLRWDSISSQWRPWVADASVGAMALDAATPAALDGHFGGRFSTGNYAGGQFCVLVTAGATVTDLTWHGWSF